MLLSTRGAFAKFTGHHIYPRPRHSVDADAPGGRYPPTGRSRGLLEILKFIVMNGMPLFQNESGFIYRRTRRPPNRGFDVDTAQPVSMRYGITRITIFQSRRVSRIL